MITTITASSIQFATVISHHHGQMMSPDGVLCQVHNHSGLFARHPSSVSFRSASFVLDASSAGHDSLGKINGCGKTTMTCSWCPPDPSQLKLLRMTRDGW